MTYIFIAALIIAIIFLMNWQVDLIEENRQLKELLECQDQLIEELEKINNFKNGN